jgi:micrococcal nuclease
MSWRRAVPWLLLFAAVAAFGTRGLLPGAVGGAGREGRGGAEPVPAGAAGDVRVTRVVDGDTIHVAIGGRDEPVRYIGMDTPESKKPDTPVQCFALAASAENRRLVAGRRVRLRFDVEHRDRYGRLLAYVYRRPDGLFVNAELVRRGFARQLTIPPDVAHAALFGRLARSARRAGRGLWGRC